MAIGIHVRRALKEQKIRKQKGAAELSRAEANYCCHICKGKRNITHIISPNGKALLTCEQCIEQYFITE